MNTSTKFADTLNHIFQTRHGLQNRDTTNMSDKYEHFNAYARAYQCFIDNLAIIETTENRTIFINCIKPILYDRKFLTSDQVDQLTNQELMKVNDLNNFSVENRNWIEVNCDLLLNDVVDYNNIDDINLLIVYFLKVASFVLIKWKYSPDLNNHFITSLDNKLRETGNAMFSYPFQHYGNYYKIFMNEYKNCGKINELKEILDILTPYYLNLMQDNDA